MAVMVASERVTAEQGMMFVRLYTVGVRRCRLDDATTTINCNCVLTTISNRRRFRFTNLIDRRDFTTFSKQNTKNKPVRGGRWRDIYLNSGFEHAHAHTNTHTHTHADHTKKRSVARYGNMHRTHTADKPAVSNNSGDPVLNVYCSCSTVLPT